MNELILSTEIYLPDNLSITARNYLYYIKMEKLDFRTDRDELRPVKWEVQKYDGFTPTGSNTFTGHFHGWFKKDTNEGPETVFGLIEKEDGTMIEIRATLINFLPKSTAIERLAKDAKERLSDLSLKS